MKRVKYGGGVLKDFQQYPNISEIFPNMTSATEEGWCTRGFPVVAQGLRKRGWGSIKT